MSRSPVAVGSALVTAALAVALAGCGESTPFGPDAGGVDASVASPLATEPPEPLSTDAGAPSDGGIVGIPADSSGRLLLPDGGVAPPEPFRADGPVAFEPPGAKDLAGLSLEASFRWRDVPAQPKAPEVSADGLKEALKATTLGLKIEVTESGRLRFELASRALPLPARTELRARSDRYGHVLLWPNSTDYRIVPAGALRTLLGERRVDVMPLVSGQVKPAGEAKRLGVVVRKVDVTAPLGTLRLELGKVTEAGEGGPLLCRMFVEMLGVDPKSSVCQAGEIPLSASYAWQDGGGIAWEATTLNRRVDFLPGDFVVPPAGARHAPSGLPIAPGGVFLSREELAAFRTGPTSGPSPANPSAPGEGFIAVNQTDTLLYLLLDGVPVAIVPPLAETYVIGTVHGRYSVQWRTFLGEKVFPPSQIEMPARFSIGSAVGSAGDAGAPVPGADAGK